MKSSLLLSIFLIVCQLTYCQDFITKWTFDKAKSGIKFSVLTTDTVHYTWTASPSGNSGNGSFIQTTPAPVLLIGLNVMAGDTVVLNMESDNLNRFYFENGQDQRSLFDVSQWGDVAWTSMHKTFFWTSDLIISASDSPDLSNVTDMSRMFSGASSINADIGGWDVSNVTDMRAMFSSANSFNKDISNWDVSNVTDMGFMFFGTDSFNQNIGNWDVSNVTDMTNMFFWATSFNQDINRWDVSNVTYMGGMFSWASTFNADIGDWNVSNVTIMYSMFKGANSFNQNIGDWILKPNVRMGYMLDGSGMDCDHYSATLVGWQKNNPGVTDVTLGALGLEYGTKAEAARNALINEQGWSVEGDVVSGMNCDAFIDGENQDFITQWTFDETTTDLRFSALTTDTVHYIWTASPSGNSGNGSFIQTTPDSVTLNWLEIAVGDTLTLNMMSDNLSRFYFETVLQDQESLIDVSQWGDVSWTSMSKAFSGCDRLQISAIDTPDLRNVTSMDSMFNEATRFNDNIGDWDVSKVTNMFGMFSGAKSFNQDIGEWNVSKVTDMGAMFRFANSFNQDIGAWDVSNVTDMSYMFWEALRFNLDISSWDVSNVTDMESMFSSAIRFNQDISSWDVSNVTDMNFMFGRATSFNQYIGNWDVSNVIHMSFMFGNATSFNQDLRDWDVSNVIYMSSMFAQAKSFNQDIGGWDVSNARDMREMFRNASSFNQDIGNWKLLLYKHIIMYSMLDSSGMDCDHYSATLVGWQKNNPSVSAVTLGVRGLEYGTSAVAARDSLINEQGWTIEGDVASGMECDKLVSTDYTASDHRLTIYPNPASDQITIKGDQLKLKDIRVLNAMGQDVTTQIVIRKQSPAITTIDLSTLNGGIYFIKSSSGSGMIYKE